MKHSRLLPALILGALSVSAALADAPSIRTNRTSEQVLPLPKIDDGFHFIIFGDRTGGPPEGVKVLAQAVQDTNHLDPDLVMTVGDLVQGYNARDLWEKQMQEYRGIMDGLRMPWFPVAGNHDIFWRGEGRPANEHEANYEKHFGPLWYWFEHKKCGFLVLFSDEGDPAREGEVRDFQDRTQQRFSDAQLAWLKQSLEEMKGLRHVFLFMHHPRWATDLYPATNWPEVHKALVGAGNVRACFAGHIHRLRYEGVKDGIEYFALAATGGGIPGDYPRAGYLHHFNVVSVRPEGIKVAALPVGTVIDPRLHTPERAKDMDQARSMNPQVTSAPMTLRADGLGAGAYEVSLRNPTQRPLEFTLTSEPTAEWILTPDHQHAVVEPGQTKAFALTYVRVKPGFADPVTPPVFTLETDYLEEGARTPLPPRSFPAKVAISDLPPETFAPAAPEHALHVTAEKSGVRVENGSFELPDGPFTVECWARQEADQPTAGLLAKTQSSDYGLLVEKGLVTFLVSLNDRYASAAATTPLPRGQWVHVAGVFDGQSVSLFLDGKKVASAPARGVRLRNDLPLYVGADPGAEGVATRSFQGWVDEVRVSKTARYTADFAPARRHEPDAETVLLLHLDRTLSSFHPDHSASHAHGTAVGPVKLEPAP